jgi:hypothetical protein
MSLCRKSQPAYLWKESRLSIKEDLTNCFLFTWFRTDYKQLNKSTCAPGRPKNRSGIWLPPGSWLLPGCPPPLPASAPSRSRCLFHSRSPGSCIGQLESIRRIQWMPFKKPFYYEKLQRSSRNSKMNSHTDFPKWSLTCFHIYFTHPHRKNITDHYRHQDILPLNTSKIKILPKIRPPCNDHIW